MPVGNLAQVNLRKHLVIAWGWARDPDTDEPIAAHGSGAAGRVERAFTRAREAAARKAEVRAGQPSQIGGVAGLLGVRDAVAADGEALGGGLGDLWGKGKGCW